MMASTLLRNLPSVEKWVRAMHGYLDRKAFVTAVHTAPVRIRIRKVPPSDWLEGFDLRGYHFREGEVYEVGHQLADVLIAWGYAELEVRRTERDQAADKSRRR